MTSETPIKIRTVDCGTSAGSAFTASLKPVMLNTIDSSMLIVEPSNQPPIVAAVHHSHSRGWLKDAACASVSFMTHPFLRAAC